MLSDDRGSPRRVADAMRRNVSLLVIVPVAIYAILSTTGLKVSRAEPKPRLLNVCTSQPVTCLQSESINQQDLLNGRRILNIKDA